MKNESIGKSKDIFVSPRKQHLQPRYMDPKSFASYKQKSSQELFHQKGGFVEEENLYKKYYGRKLLYLSNSKKNATISAINSSKLFRSISLCRNLFSDCQFKALGNMIVVGSRFELREKQQRKIMRRSNGKLAFSLDHRKTKALRDLYGLRGFKTLELFLTKKEQLSEFNPGILKEFSRLEKFTIEFHPIYHFRQGTIFLKEERMKQTFKFLLKIIENSQALKIFYCDLSPFYMEPKFLRKLLLYVDNYNVESWYIKARISFQDFFEITQTNSRLKNRNLEEGVNTFQQVLGTVDLLGLHNSENIDNDLTEICEREGQNGQEPYLLSKISSMLRRHNRILDIDEFFIGDKKSTNSTDLGNLLQKFDSLRGLHIHITQGDLILENSNKIESLVHLRNIVFSEVGHSLYRRETLKKQIVQNLLTLLAKSSPKLKRMQVYSNSFEILGERDFGFLIKRDLRIHENYLENFKRLRELEMNTDDGFPNGFEKVVKRLKILKVNFENFQNKKYDLQIAPFVGNHLKELHLRIWPKQQAICWIDKLAWNLDRFPDLEVLVVDDQGDNRIKLESLCKFLKAVNKLKNLKRLVVKMKLEESRNEDYSNLLGDEVQKTIYLLEEEMVKSIENDILRMTNSNVNLEEIEIQGFCGHRIEGIFYKKTKIIRKEPEKNIFGTFGKSVSG